MDSILATIKKLLGIEEDYNEFDTDIILGINSAFMSLNQVGVGPAEPFRITGSDETWDDFLGTATKYEAAKDYIYLKVRLVFDPPASSAMVDAMERQCKELEWRLLVQAEPDPPVIPPPEE